MQRTGRKGHAMFRLVVPASRRNPTSGKIVASLGSYDPHAKNVVINKEKAQFYLDHGAQPSGRVTTLLKAEGVKLPSWVEAADKKSGKIRNLEKLRRNRPAEEVKEEVVAEAEPAEVEESVEAPAEAVPEAEVTEEAPTDTVETEAPAEEIPVEEPVAEAPSEEAAPETPAADESADADKKAA